MHKITGSIFLMVYCSVAFGQASSQSINASHKNGLHTTQIQHRDCVILLHGMGRTAFSMSKIADTLVDAGYVVWNESYPSMSASIEQLSESAVEAGLTYCENADSKQVHFVTHSLGGILLRHYLQSNNITHVNKIVMLSPPNHGSEIVDRFHNNWLFRALMGPAFLQLGTDGIVTDMQTIPGTIGVITGNESSDPWFSEIIPGPDDGKVSVVSAQLPEMADFLIVPAGHTFIMNDDTVIQQIEYFFDHGRFQTLETTNQSGQSAQ